MSGFACVLLNEGTSASALTVHVTQAWLTRCATACAMQLVRDVAPYWGRAVAAVRAGSTSTDVQPGEFVFALVDSLPDAPGAIAYHDVNGAAVPVAYLALSTCSTLDDVSSAASHELCETLGDEACNRWCDDSAGAEFALELCDAVESNAYPIDLSDGQPPVMVSDFLLPAFFSSASAPPFNFMAVGGNPMVPTPATHNPLGPFGTAPGGYQIKRTSGTGEAQVQAHADSLRGQRALHGAHHWSSRPARRHVARREALQTPLPAVP